MLDIIKAPSPVLSGNSKDVARIDKSVTNLIEGMKAALLSAYDPVGVGLAAPQVGKALKIFIAKPSQKSKISVFINPVITKEENLLNIDSEKAVKLEGCLSLPNIWGEVKRFDLIHVDFMDEHGQKHSQKFTGFMSVIIQHELDHLNGVLFPKRVLEQKGALYESHKNQKGEDVFEEIKV